MMQRIKHVAFNEASFPCCSYIKRSFQNSIFSSLTVEKPILQSCYSHIWGKVFPYACASTRRIAFVKRTIFLVLHDFSFHDREETDKNKVKINKKIKVTLGF